MFPGLAFIKHMISSFCGRITSFLESFSDILLFSIWIPIHYIIYITLPYLCFTLQYRVCTHVIMPFRCSAPTTGTSTICQLSVDFLSLCRRTSWAIIDHSIQKVFCPKQAWLCICFDKLFGSLKEKKKSLLLCNILLHPFSIQHNVWYMILA